MKEMNKYLGRMKVLELKPDDIIVLEVKESFSMTVHEKLLKRLESIFPKNKCIVIEKMKLSVIRNNSSKVKPPATPKPSKGMLIQ